MRFSLAAALKDAGNLLSATKSNTRRNTLPRIEILRGFGAFKEVFQAGKRISGEHIHCHVTERSSLSIESLPTNVPVLVGFSISRKTRTAVERNRLKRLLREAYRTNKHELIEYCMSNERQLILLFSFWDVQSIEPKKIAYSIVENEVKHLLSKITVMCQEHRA